MQPGQFTPPGDEGWIGRKFQDLERQLNELRAANPFATMGVKPMPDGLVVEGYETVNGPLLINGPATITGALNLPAGIIGNDALANPMIVEASSNYLNNYAVGTTSTVRATVTLAVPDGFTSAVVMTNAAGMAQNSTGTVDYLYVQAVVDGVNGGEMYTSAGAGLAVGIASPFNTTIYGLTDGQLITVSVATRTGFATWSASTANQANIYATVLYFR
jgi:hypothetical protein